MIDIAKNIYFNIALGIAMRSSPSKLAAVILVTIMIVSSRSLYSPYYKRCRVNKHSDAVDLNATAIE